MSLRKKLQRNPLVLGAITWLLAAYIRFVYHTTRWTWVGRERLEAIAYSKQGLIGAFWHNRLMLMPFAWPKDVPMDMMISAHDDGRIISGVIRRFGIGTVEGSTSKRGVQALKSVVDRMKNGHCVAITPDGPRGPRMRAAAGVVAASRLSGAPIVPVSLSVRNRKVLGSWDRFIFALPFGRGVFVIGEPIQVPKRANADEVEHFRLLIEETLTALSDEADRLVGQQQVEPASKDTKVKGA